MQRRAEADLGVADAVHVAVADELASDPLERPPRLKQPDRDVKSGEARAQRHARPEAQSAHKLVGIGRGRNETGVPRQGDQSIVPQ